MIFTNMFYKNHRSPLSKLRQHQSQQPPMTLPANAPDWSGDEHADLVSRDKTKVKEAVRRYLSDKVRNDWDFNWRPALPGDPDATIHPGKQRGPNDTANVQDELDDEEGYRVDGETDDAEDVDTAGSDDDDDALSIYSVVSADPVHYKTRKEWDSDAPIDDSVPNGSPGMHAQGDADAQVSNLERRAQKRRELRKEMVWNEGVACFEARRNAWTQARTVRLRVKPELPPPTSSQRSPRRFFFRRSMSSASSQAGHSQSGASGVTSEASAPGRDHEKDPNKQNDKVSMSACSAETSVNSFPVETIIPVPPPILPPNNPLRASITPGNYLQLYDKLIVNNMQPSCPVNLSDMISACVAGWRRDGEWSPRPTLHLDTSFNTGGASRHRKSRSSMVSASGTTTNAGRRMSLTGLLSRDKDSECRTGKGVRHSLQKAFGLGPPVSSHMDTSVAAEKNRNY